MRLFYYLQKIRLILLGQNRTIIGSLPWGDRFVLKLERAVDRQIYLCRFEPMETKIVSAMVEEGKVCVDVGANIGYYTALMVHGVGSSGRVIAFEPGQQITPWLKVNLEINSLLDNVIILNEAVSDEEGKVIFYECEDAAYSSILEGATDYARERRRYDVQTVTLDSALLQLGCMQEVCLVKIDVEGGESSVIDGAWKLLEETRPVLMIEYFHLNLRGQKGDKSKFINKLLNIGYRGFVLNKLQHKLEEFTKPNVEGNLIFVHSSQSEKINTLMNISL